MIKLYNKDFTTEYGYINSICEAFVEEERNGLFELSFIMLNTDKLFSHIKEDNIVVANANDTLLNQKFRIYMTRKLMNNRIEVFARHISFDLMYDYIDSISFENQSCEYALNQLFRNSNFSKHYKGYSDITNAQDYSMSMANVLEAIGGKKGSVIDTFGTGAEILRDNENIHVLNKRGHDNSVTIEYKKNLTGFELEEDTTELITRILPYAKYTNNETNEEVIVKADYVDSPRIANYSHPFIAAIDLTERIEGFEINKENLTIFANRYFDETKCDRPKQNFKIDFIPLSKCVGYEGLEDKISLCDTVTIIDTRYNVNTQAKVIKTVFNVLKNRYESIELGNPKTSLADIVGNGGNEAIVGPPGPQGPPGADGSIGDFPNSLPVTPVVTATVYGFANIEISWTFENKVYYQYEVYASKEVDFTPNTFNLIHQGQTSTFMYQAKPNETWYFKVCCVNTHGERTAFGSAYATTVKIDDLSNYVENMAIDDALIGTLKLDRGWVGKLSANLLDVKGNFSVTDGNGKRTLDVDSFGNVSLQPTNLNIDADADISIVSPDLNMDKYSILMKRNNNKSIALKKGSLYFYDYRDGMFLGGEVPHIVQGQTSFNTGISMVSSSAGYFYSISKAYDWSSDESISMTPTSYFIINFRDRGTQSTDKAGTHILGYPLYAHKGINLDGQNIENVGNNYAVNQHSTNYKNHAGKTMFSTTGTSTTGIINNNTDWDWKGFNLVNPKIITYNSLSEEVELTSDYMETKENTKKEQEQQNEEILTNMMASAEIFEMMLSMMTATLSENKNVKNIGGSSMVEVYATLIIKGVKTIEDVPAIIKDQVIKRLIELEIPFK